MKNTVMIPFVFAGRLLSWLGIIGIFSLFVSEPVLSLLVDKQYGYFFTTLLQSVLAYAPLAVMCALLNVFFYIMRHRTILLVSMILVGAIAAASVLFLLPLTYRATDRLASRFTAADSELEKSVSRVYTGECIRTGPEMLQKVWFDVSVTGDSVRPVILVNTAVLPGARAMTVYESASYDPLTGSLLHDSLVVVPEAGGIDPLAAKVEAPFFIGLMYTAFDPVLSAFRVAFQSGFTGYLYVSSAFFAAIAALWCLCYLTSWRLLNALAVLAGFASLFLVYSQTVSGFVPNLLSRIPYLTGKADLYSPAAYAGIAALIVVCVMPFVCIRLAKTKKGAFHG